MEKMMHISRLQNLVDQKDPSGKPLPFSITYRKKDGTLIQSEEVVCTSWFSNGRTLNLMYTQSREVRKIRRILVFKINEITLYL
jgi:hypothetical protein